MGFRSKFDLDQGIARGSLENAAAGCAVVRIKSAARDMGKIDQSKYYSYRAPVPVPTPALAYGARGRELCPECRSPMTRAQLIPGLSMLNARAFWCAPCKQVRLVDGARSEGRPCSGSSMK